MIGDHKYNQRSCLVYEAALFDTMQYNLPAKRDDAEASSFMGEREKEKNAYIRETPLPENKYKPAGWE